MATMDFFPKTRKAETRPTQVQWTGTECPICGANVKLNELIRSAYHIIGCKVCKGRSQN